MTLIVPTVRTPQWAANRFRDRVWVRSVEAAIENDPDKRDDAPSIFEGFTFTRRATPLLR